MSKRFFILLIGLFIFLPGCNGDLQKKPEQQNGKNEGATYSGDADIAETTERFTPNLPEITFDGYEFRALIPIKNMYSSFTFCVDEETGDIFDDAVYKRNKFIEEKYDVVFSQTEVSDFNIMADMFKRSVMSDSDDFDISAQGDGMDLAIQGYTLFTDKLPYMDITKPWYMHDVNETYRIGNKYLVIFSDECISVYDVTVAVCFNKNLISDLGLENPYSLVQSGAWTYDKFFDMCRAAAADTDGDGIMGDMDRYGILSQYDELLAPFWVCAEIQTVVKDAGGMLTLNFANNENLLGILDKIHQNIYGGKKIFFDTHPYIGDKLTSYNSGDITVGGFIDVSRQQFENNQGLFLTARLGRIPDLRAMDADFGLLPYPKADENQDSYHVMSGGAWPRVVPSHAVNPERTSIILEALAAESKNIVIPAYKEICLKTKFTRDDESGEMLNIIFENVLEDLGTTIFWSTVRNALIDEVVKKGNFTSVIEKQSARLEKDLNKINELIINLG